MEVDTAETLENPIGWNIPKIEESNSVVDSTETGMKK